MKKSKVILFPGPLKPAPIARIASIKIRDKKDLELDFFIAGGIFFRAHGMYEVAVECFSEYLHRVPIIDPVLLVELGFALVGAQRFFDAIDCFQKVVDLGYGSSRVYRVLSTLSCLIDGASAETLIGTKIDDSDISDILRDESLVNMVSHLLEEVDQKGAKLPIHALFEEYLKTHKVS